VEPLLWIVLGAALAIAEIFTTTLFLIMFSIGAFAAAGAAALGAPVPLQAVVFAAVSALTVAVLRPAIRRRQVTGDADGGRFGVAAIEGSRAVVLERVDRDNGLVKIDGEVWTARAADAGEAYQPGERVRVVEVNGATAVVWRDYPTGELPMRKGE
jgi:membrane protein implicated in regulation of membrane protease activity